MAGRFIPITVKRKTELKIWFTLSIAVMVPILAVIVVLYTVNSDNGNVKFVIFEDHFADVDV